MRKPRDLDFKDLKMNIIISKISSSQNEPPLLGCKQQDGTSLPVNRGTIAKESWRFVGGSELALICLPCYISKV